MESARVRGSNKDVFLADSWRWIELGRSFHQEGAFNLKVRESDFVALWDGTIKAQYIY